MEWIGIIAFVCLGAFIGIVINSLQKAKGTLLQREFINLGNLVGLSLFEITEKVGVPSAVTKCTVGDTGKPGKLCTWSKMPYSITLIFDVNNKCLGVNKEVKM